MYCISSLLRQSLLEIREPCRKVTSFIHTLNLYKNASTVQDGSSVSHAERHQAAASTDSRKQEIDEIVRHMQVLALLRNPTKDGAVHGEEEQVEYLLSAMDIADKLMAVDTADVEPFHSVLENEVTYLQSDKPLVIDKSEREIMCSISQCYKFGMYVAPPIPATKVSRRVTKEVIDNQDDEF